MVLLASSAAAQLDTGTILGTVTDASGAVLSGVTVTITQDETGVATTTVTTPAGSTCSRTCVSGATR